MDEEFDEMAYIIAARRMYEREGTLEIDEGCVVSISEDREGPIGAYVQAWVFVRREDCRESGEPQ